MVLDQHIFLLSAQPCSTRALSCLPLSAFVDEESEGNGSACFQALEISMCFNRVVMPVRGDGQITHTPVPSKTKHENDDCASMPKAHLE